MSARFGSVSAGRQAIIRERLLYIGGGAITFALAAIVALIIYSYNEADAHQSVTAPQQPLEQVAFGTVVLLAPTTPIPRGTQINQAPMKEIHWPRNEVPEGAVRRAEDIREMYAKVDIPADQPILRANLSATPPLGGISDAIPPGHRAATIEVDATTGVEGWATPGAHVDVLVTYHDLEDGKKKTQIAVEDAVVLSYNGQTRTSTLRGEGVSPIVPKTATVTLAVPFRDAIRMRTAAAMGEISLILRSSSDMKSVGPQMVTSDDLRHDGQEPQREYREPDGRVRYTDSTGRSVELELGPDQRWRKIRGLE
ncbi:MAG: Flp pilus assembly protein CpaB [Bdellovibrionales bacterium]|nr:Flp pilus assembly protein CpaB [Bdellovibrionales bacterium]